jgi:hypothetical protein
MLMSGDADLIAGGLLLELKVSAKPVSLGVLDAWQLLGYALMDYTDEFGITDVAVFSARYAYLAQWDLATLLSQLAWETVVVADVREEFKELLEACQFD